MGVKIRIDQGTNGTPGVAREDLATGVDATLTAVGGPFFQYLWRFVSVPIDMALGVRASAAVNPPDASTTTCSPLNVAGTYHVELVVDSGSGLGALPEDIARITFYAGPPLATDPGALPRRIPAFSETTEHNVPDGIDTAGNTEGWSREWLRWFEVIKRAADGSSGSWALVSLPSGGPASLVDGVNVASINRIDAGVVDVVFVTALPNANFAVVATACGTPGGSCSVYNQTTSGFRMERADFGGGLVDADFSFDVRVRL